MLNMVINKVSVVLLEAVPERVEVALAPVEGVAAFE